MDQKPNTNSSERKVIRLSDRIDIKENKGQDSSKQNK